jgi:hypothetical protein
MWQPSRAQWRLLWTAAVLLILAWPDQHASLAVKAINWVADPFQSLPESPRPLALGQGDDVEAVAAHDADESAYYRIWRDGGVGRLRLRLKSLTDPFDPSTERQLLVGAALLCALGIWRFEPRCAP